MQMVQIWDMVQKVLAFYCWQDEMKAACMWGVQTVRGRHSTASITPLVSHLFGDGGELCLLTGRTSTLHHHHHHALMTQLEG